MDGKKRMANQMLKRVARKRSPAVTSNGNLTLGKEAYQKIRHCILSGDFAPGAALSEYQLAVQFHLSRTPVREALTRLAQGGLVRTVAGRGTFVAELTPHDIMEIYEVREQLECYAARIAAERLDTVGLSELENNIQQVRQIAASGYSQAAFHSTDLSLHRIIVRSTQNNRLIAILSTLDDQMHRIRSIWPRTRQSFERVLVEHAAIVNCIVARDPNGAETAMRTHLRNSCEHGIRFLMPMRMD